MKLLLILLLIPFSIEAKVFSTNQWIDLYLRNCKPGRFACRQELEKNLGRMFSYQKLTFKYLDKEGLPRWLATVPIIESSYNDLAESPASALGLWQIMPFNIRAWKTRKITILGRTIKYIPTASQVRRYGFNPVVSTQLATKHLSRLYKRYREHKNTEELALMAYNAGASKINRWLAGKTTLADETKNYYTKLMAIQYIMKHSKQLKITPVKHKRRFFLAYIKSLTRLEDSIELDHAHLIIKEVLG